MQVRVIRVKPSSANAAICNVQYVFPCMSKSVIENVDVFLKKQLDKGKRQRNWKLIQCCLRYWTQYCSIVKVWLESMTIQVMRNGKQLFESLLLLSPGSNVAGLLKSLTSREAFLENPIIFYSQSVYSLLQVHGGQKVFQLNEVQEKEEIDWEEDVEDEALLEARIDQRLGRRATFVTPDSQKARGSLPNTRSSTVSYHSAMQQIINYDLVDVLVKRLTENSFAYSTEKMNNAVATLMEQLVQFFQGKPLWLFFNIEYLGVFMEFYEIDNILLRKQQSFKRIKKVIDKIFQSYCEIWKKNELLPMESLFRFKNLERVNRVVKNYPFLRGDASQDVDVHSNPTTRLGDLRDKLEDEMGDVSVFMQKKLWTEKEDLFMAQNFNDLILRDRVFERIKEKLKSTLNSEKTIAQIRKRIKFLDLEHLSEDRAVIKIQTLHSGKLNFQRVLRLVMKPLKPAQRQEHWASFMRFMNQVISEFAEFKIEYPDSLQEFAVIPQEPAEFKSVFVFQSVLQSMDLVNPRGKRAFWRVPNYISAEQLQERLDKFDKISKSLDENLKSKTPKKSSRNEIDKEFGDLLEDDIDIGGDVSSEEKVIRKEHRPAKERIIKKSSKANVKPKRRLKKIKVKMRKGMKRKMPEGLGKIIEEDEIEGLVSDAQSDNESIASLVSNGKENRKSTQQENIEAN